MHAQPSAHDAWSRVLSVVRDQVTDQTYRTWFMPLRPRSYDARELTLEVPNPFFVDWLQEHHATLLESAAQSALDGDVGISFAVSTEYSDRALPATPTPQAGTNGTPLRPAGGSLDRRSPSPAEDYHLNRRFTFANFVVGKSNEFCCAACEAVSRSPGRVYNPLFIYGGVGLGKTHIMQAIGNHALIERHGAAVRYVSSEKFMNEMIQSIRRGTTFDFKQRYRSADVLLIDDIQFLAGKESTQEEFFHTFNTLYDAQKQIVITADRPPRELRDLEERLVSRFNWGLVADINPPDYETRVAILRRKAESEELVIPDDVILLIAERVTNNVRELEGSLIRLSALASLTGSTITADLAAEFLKDMIHSQAMRPISVIDIIRAVGRHFGVTVDALRGKRRTSQIAYPRQVAMFLAKQLTDASLVEIGRQLGGRDHTTVMYACDKIGRVREQDPALGRALEEITAKLRPTPSRSF